MHISIQIKVNMNNKLVAMIVSSTQYKEKDALVRMISEEGKSITMIAKGANAPTSKYGAYLQPFNVCAIECHIKEPLSTFMSASILKTFSFSDIHHLASASFIVQSMDAINQMEPHSFDCWKAVEYLNLIQHSMLAALLKFCFNCFEMDGRQLIVDECVDCGSLQVSGFSLSAGGFVCKNCSHFEKVDLHDIEVLKTLRCISKAPLELTYRCPSHALSMGMIQLFVHDLKDSIPLAMKSWKFMDDLV